MDQVCQLNAAIQAQIEILPGEAGVFAQTLCGAHQLAIGADETFPSGSSIKLFVLYATLWLTDRRRVSLSERIEYDKRFSTPGSGVLTHLDAGLSPTVRDLATLMMMISDNSATNILIDYLSLDTINNVIRDIPLNSTYIGSWVNFRDSDRDSLSLGASTPREMCQFLRRLRSAELLSLASTEIFWDILRIQKYIEPLRRHLPASPWAREWEQPEPVWVASKSGHLIDCTTETGLVHAHGAEWVISVMTRNMPWEDPDNVGERFVSDVSRLVFEAWSPQD